MKPLSPVLKAQALELAQLVLERLETDRLTRVPLLHLEELPALSGVYLAATEDNQILYIGKAENFTERCKISTHHKLPTAIEKGAVFLYVASVPTDQAWHVEQWLIRELSPELNEVVSKWWIEPVTQSSEEEGLIGISSADRQVVNLLYRRVPDEWEIFHAHKRLICFCAPTLEEAKCFAQGAKKSIQTAANALKTRIAILYGTEQTKYKVFYNHQLTRTQASSDWARTLTEVIGMREMARSEVLRR